MPEPITAPRTYVAVLIALLLLTVLTVAISFVPLGLSVWHIVVGLAIAICKATLVVLFFMHALHSPQVTWIVISAAIFWLGILLVLTLTDYFSRGLLPYPGH